MAESEILKIDLGDVPAQLADLQRKLAALNEEQKKVAESSGVTSEAYQELNLQIAVTRKEINQTKAVGEAIIAQNKAQTGSLTELRAALRQSEIAYANLSKAERENGAEGKRLRETLLNLRNSLKAAEGATGDFRRNVGDYRNAVREAGAELLNQSPILNTLVTNFKSLTTIIKGANLGFKALTGGATTAGFAIRAALLGPILLLIAAGAGIVAFFTRTKEGSDKFSQGLAFLQGVFSGLIKIVADFGKVIIDALSSPEKLLDLLVSQFSNRLQGLVDALTSFGEVIAGVFTLDKERAAQGLRDFGKAQITILSGLSKEAQNAIGNTLVAAGNAYLEAEKRIQAVDERIRKLTKTNIELQQNIEKNDKLIDNNSKTFAEREKAAKAAIAAQKQLNNNLVSIAKEQLAIAKIKQGVDGKTKDNVKEISDLEAKVLEVQSAGLTKIADIENKLENVKISRRLSDLNDEKAAIETKLIDVKKFSDEELKLRQELVAKNAQIEASAAGLTEDQRTNIINKGIEEQEALAKQFRIDKAKADIEAVNLALDKELQEVEAGTLERLLLEKNANDIKLTNALTLIDLEVKAEKEKENAKTKIRTDFKKTQDELDKQIADKLKKEKETETNNELARLKLLTENEQAELQTRLDAQFELLELEKQQRIEAAKTTGESIANIEEEFRQRSLKQTKDAEQQKQDVAVKDAQSTFGFLSQLSDLAYQADLAAAGDNAEEKARIDAAYAKRQKRLKLFEIVLNQSAAIAKTLADTPTPANFAFAVAVGAQIAGLIGQVAALQFNKGGRVPGVGNTDTVPAILTPGEVVINKRAAEKNLGLLDSINRSTGGAPLIPQRLNTGGIVLPVNNGASGLSTEDLIAAFNQLPTPVVSVQQINRAQRNNVEVRQTATL